MRQKFEPVSERWGVPRELLRNLSERNPLLKLLFGASLVSVVGPVALLGMTTLLAHRFGPEQFGLFSVVLGLASILAPVSSLGLANASTRLIPEYSSTGRLDLLSGFALQSGRTVYVVSILSGIVLALLSWLPTISSELHLALQFGAILTPVMAVRLLRRAQLVAVGAPARGIFLDEVLPPVSVIFFVLVFGVTTVSAIILVLAVGSCIGSAIGARLLKRLLWNGARPPAPTSISLKTLLAISLPLMIGMVGNLMRNRLDVLVVAPLSTLEQVGYYGAAFRLSYLLTMPAPLICTVYAPALSAAFATGDVVSLRRQFRASLALMAIALLVLAPLALIFSELLIRITLGPQFEPSIRIFQTLCIGQIFAALAITSSALSLASRQQNSIAAINTSAFVLSGLGGALLVGHLGAEGVAAAMAAVAVLQFAAQNYVANRAFRLVDGSSRAALPMEE